MNMIFKFFVALMMPLNCIAAVGGTSVNYFDKTTDTDLAVPTYLFHWTSQVGLELMNEQFDKKGQLSFRPIDNNAVASVRSLRGKPGLFTWSHPWAAMGLGKELYPRFGEKTSPRLLILKINPNAKVKIVRTSWFKEVSNDLNQDHLPDIILHLAEGAVDLGESNYVQGMTTFREWIVLNPNVIENFTADPNQLPLEFKNEMLRGLVENQLSSDQRFFEVLKVQNQQDQAPDFVDRAPILLNKIESAAVYERVMNGELGSKPVPLATTRKTIRAFLASGNLQSYDFKIIPKIFRGTLDKNFSLSQCQVAF